MSEERQQVLIVGGGVSGLAAASYLAQRGIGVCLVEKKATLGGHAAEWACMATRTCEYCAACLAAEHAHQAGQMERIQVFRQSKVTKLEKTETGYRAVIEGQTSAAVAVQAVLLSTGFDVFDPGRLEYLEQDSDRVITTADCNRLLRREELDRFLSPNTATQVAFVQCVGSRNREIGNGYCSQVCCKTSLRQANKILYRYPKAHVTIFHIDLQTIGKLMRTQTVKYDGRLKLQQGVPSKIFSDRNAGRLTVINEDAATGNRVASGFDLVILAVGMQAVSDNTSLLQGLNIVPDQWGFVSREASSFPQGIFVAGAAAGPTDILSARLQGEDAAQAIIRHLNSDASKAPEFGLTVIGRGAEGLRVAQALSGFGYRVSLVDAGLQDAVPEPIVYYSNARPVSVSGSAGSFSITVADKAGKHSLKSGAVILATGTECEPYTSPALDAADDLLVSLSDFARQVAGLKEGLPETITFWLDHAGPEWKTQSRKSLALAGELAEQGRHVSVLAEKMLVHGLTGQQMYDAARKAGVKFLRVASSTDVRLSRQENQVIVEFTEATLPDIRMRIVCDRLVVPEKIVPPADNHDLALLLQEETDAEGFLQAANARHRPLGSPRRGLFYVGSCHDEADTQDLDRELAALRASLERLSDPSAGPDPAAEIEQHKCVRCLTCLRVCPHGAVLLENHYQPVIAQQACFGCGLCVSSCPAQAILPGTPVETEHQEGLAGKTVVFACDRSAHLAVREMSADGIKVPEDTVVIPVPCAGSLSLETLLQPLVQGAGKVMVTACHQGNCRSMNGSAYAAVRVEKIRSDLNLTTDRLDCRTVAANEPVWMAQLLTSTATAGKEAEND